MGRADYYESGTYNAICDQCGKKFKMNKLETQWDALVVCKKCFDYKHPQEFVRGVKDIQYVPVARPDIDPTFVPTATALEPSEAE